MGTLDALKGEVGKMNRELDSMVKRMNESFSSLWINMQTAHSNGVERLSSTPAVKSIDAGAKTIGRSVHNFKSTAEARISSAVSGVVEDLDSLRRNVDRNVQALRRSGGGGDGDGGGGGGEGDGKTNLLNPKSSPSPPAAASPMISFPASKLDMLAGVASPPREDGPQSLQGPPSPSSVPTTSSISPSPSSSFDDNEEEVSEEEPHPDLSSVSATSVFSIGYVGPPLLGPQDSESFVIDANSFEGAPSTGSETAAQEEIVAPASRLEDVRKSIGKALVVYKKIRALGIRESSWSNKMPWRNPRPPSLAKGLKWPRQKFSSVGDRHEYHRKARRRGRYLIGPTPGWSWFAADIVFLYFLINNPAGNFLI